MNGDVNPVLHHAKMGRGVTSYSNIISLLPSLSLVGPSEFSNSTQSLKNPAALNITPDAI